MQRFLLATLASILFLTPGAGAQVGSQQSGSSGSSTVDCSKPPKRSNACDDKFKTEIQACEEDYTRCKEDAGWFYDDLVCIFARSACRDLAGFRRNDCLKKQLAPYANACRPSGKPAGSTGPAGAKVMQQPEGAWTP